MRSAGTDCDVRWRPPRPRGPSPRRSRLRASTSSQRSSAGRPPRARSSLPTTPLPAPAPMRREVRRRSPSCASRTGSAGPWTICGRCALPCPFRSSPRSSLSTPGSSTSSALPARTSCSCWPSSIPASGSPGWWRRRATSGWSRSWRRMTPASWTPPCRRERGSSGSTTGTCGRSTWTRSGPSGCGTRSPGTGWRSPSPACAMPRRSPAGGSPGSTRRWSGRR